MPYLNHLRPLWALLVFGLASPVSAQSESEAAVEDDVATSTSTVTESESEGAEASVEGEDASVDPAPDSDEAGTEADEATSEEEILEDTLAAVEPPPKAAETIVVTGSRIARAKLSTPVPVTVIDSQYLEDTGSLFLADIIAQTPQLQPNFTSANSTRFIGTAGIGGANLRNLGVDRTLVLVNGRRHVGSFALSPAVDLNTIPVDLVERFEVLTGGASATYGADAVAGVVNIIMKEDFEGFIARSQYGISERGDAENWSLSATAGGFFADDKGNATISFEYTRRSRLGSEERDFSSTEFSLIPNPLDGDEPNFDDGIPDEILTQDAGINFINRNGVVVALDGQQTFNPDGSIRLFDFGDRSEINPSRQQGGDYVRLAIDDLIPEQERMLATSLLSYKFSDRAKLYSETKLVISRALGSGSGQPSFDTGSDLTVFRDNAFLPDELGSQLDIAGTSSLNMARFNIDLGAREELAERTTLRTAVGLKGELANNLLYDVGLTWGRTEALSQNGSNRINERWLAASDAVVDELGEVNGNPGEIVCRVNLQDARGETPTLPNGEPAPAFALADNRGNCVPISVFGDGGVSQDAAAFINAPTTLRSSSEQLQVMGFLSWTSDDVFELPGGPMGAVFGLEYRRDTAEQKADLADNLNLTFFNAIAPSSGAIEVAEAFGEISLPLLAGLPGVEELTVTAGGRLSNYSLEQVGTVLTTQLNGVYRPSQDVSFRASYARAIRAPNVGDAFSGLSQGFAGVADPCDEDSINDGEAIRVANCIALAEQIGASFEPGQDVSDEETRELLSGGNPDLEEETSVSWTAGLQLAPRWVPNLLISLDYYSYSIEDAIEAPNAQSIADNCVDFGSIDNRFCDLIIRNPTTFEIDLIEQINVNLASLETRGLDIAASYAFKIQDALELFGMEDAPKLGALRFNLNGNYLDSFVNFPDQTDPEDRQDLDGFAGNGAFQGFPKWRWNAVTNYSTGGFTFTYRMQWIDGFNRLSNLQEFEANPDAQDPLFVDPQAYHYIQARYTFLDQFTVYAGIDNLFDTAPPYGFNGTGGASGFYDNILRSFYVGARWDSLF